MTLTDNGATNTFSAPANATLAKETDYFVVLRGGGARVPIDLSCSLNFTRRWR